MVFNKRNNFGNIAIEQLALNLQHLYNLKSLDINLEKLFFFY